MSETTVTISADGRDTVVIGGCDTGLLLSALDLGYPTIRANVTDRPGSNGSIDRTKFYGPRTVTVGVLLNDATAAEKLALRALLNPDIRPTLTLSNYAENEPEMRAEVRVAGAARELTVNDSKFGVGRQVHQWQVPTGVFESTEKRTITLLPSSDVGIPGREYDLEHDRVYPTGGPAGLTTVTSGGSAVSYPVIQLFGPCSGGITLKHVDSLGVLRELSFPDLVIAGGDYIEIDTRTKTVRQNGIASQSLYGELDFGVSTWWAISPGTQSMQLTAGTSNDPAQAVVSFRESYI